MEEIPRKVTKGVRRFPWKFFLSIVVFVLCASAGVVFGLAQWMSRDLPDIAKLSAIEPPVRSTVYDVKGREISAFFKENRDVVPLKAIPKNLVNATLATEDRHFYSHWGVDMGGITRAALKNVLNLRTTQGGSTITQQLARNLFLTHERTLDRKFKELVIALRIEKMYSKQEILEMYFNQIYFGHGAYGVQSAARTFFGKDIRQLTLPEAALLAGLPQNPSRHSPFRQPQNALARRNLVLRNMLETKTISRNQYETAIRAPLGVLDLAATAGLAPYFVEMVRIYLDDKYGSNLVYEGGLRIYTSLDLDLQRDSEKALEKQLLDLERRFKYKKTRENFVVPVTETKEGAPPVVPSTQTPYVQGALVALDVKTGYVRAMVGGRDFKHSSFNRAVQALRQPGSAFKPFIYTAAIDNGFKPTDVVVDEPISLPGGENGALWTPHNYDGEYSGPVTLRYALQRSINIPSIKLLRKLGVSLVASYGRRMGIKSKIQPNLSMALGTSEVNLLEITSAYAVIANDGIRNEPAFVLKVEDKSGAVLETHQPKPVDVLSSETAGVMTSMLQSVVDHGTGYPARARGFLLPAAGKTGTTDDYSDAWFVGYTPSLVCGVWVGFDVKKPMGKGVTGSVGALPVWTDFMIAAYRGRPVEYFNLPTQGETHEICTETGLLATEACPTVTAETFTPGSEPTEYCHVHVGLPRQPGRPEVPYDSEAPGAKPAPPPAGPTPVGVPFMPPPSPTPPPTRDEKPAREPTAARSPARSPAAGTAAATADH
ncbi:MAG: penicillin-binding protein 1A [Candidatus Eiseniibacteriota bacterium]